MAFPQADLLAHNVSFVGSSVQLQVVSIGTCSKLGVYIVGSTVNIFFCDCRELVVIVWQPSLVILRARRGSCWLCCWLLGRCGCWDGWFSGSWWGRAHNLSGVAISVQLQVVSIVIPIIVPIGCEFPGNDITINKASR